MKKIHIALLLAVTSGAAVCLSFKGVHEDPDIALLRKLYSSGDPAQWPKAIVDPNVKNFKDIGALPEVVHPKDNPFNAAKKELGKTLFFDPRLSVSGQIACASCHDPQLGWGDGKRVSFGHDRQLGKRNAMSLFNTAYFEKLFWDGRANSLEDQARFPIADHVEMNMNVNDMEKKVKTFSGYKPMFKAAFGSDSISMDKIFKAIACFERTIVSPESRFDLFIKGRSQALKDEEVLGLHLFRTKAGCVNCHNSGVFSDDQFHNDGQTLFASASEDLGLYNVTKNRSDVGKFRTPSLRETANTGPWFHHGNFPTLKDVVFFYNLGNPSPIQRVYKGDRDSLLPKTSPILKKLSLNDREIDALIAFLHSITTTPQRLKPITDFPK
ncbi:cytochrome-c peroxidase [Parasegetibacter sp. NRK P23]|uniref:cytochrome-c peroxidase n=1 Tax=Parasegetibacter sp. NRK P23 TaxID=2942999 RepID=UPI0020436F79|nr:cytochrome c peroxidase [Parasegetibacter sp. NRK P23]MCM5527912.1 cytochrome-c peroxidase [Parasegetibacter sp. NRK P23]